MGTYIFERLPTPNAIQLKSRGIALDDLTRPVQNKVPEVAATTFDHSASKKVVRLLDVDLEFGTATNSSWRECDSGVGIDGGERNELHAYCEQRL